MTLKELMKIHEILTQESDRLKLRYQEVDKKAMENPTNGNDPIVRTAREKWYEVNRILNKLETSEWGEL